MDRSSQGPVACRTWLESFLFRLYFLRITRSTGINWSRSRYSSRNVRRAPVIETDSDAAQRSARFQQMALPHLDAAFNLARWLCGNPNDAEDIVQDAYMRAFRYFDMFHGDNARPWLLTIVRRTWYSEWQKREMSRHSVEFDENLDDAMFEGWSEPHADPETLMMRDQDARLVHEALEQLPAEYREVMVLRELEELSYREIATIADLPVGTVMSRLARGRRRLAAALASLQARAVGGTGAAGGPVSSRGGAAGSTGVAGGSASSRGAAAGSAGAAGGSASSRGVAAGSIGATGGLASSRGAAAGVAATGAGARGARDRRCGTGAAGASASALASASLASLSQADGVSPSALINRAGERPATADRAPGNPPDQALRNPGTMPGSIAQENPDEL
jgi:RNA polymerase sigma factor (sigma-70 family)